MQQVGKLNISRINEFIKMINKTLSFLQLFFFWLDILNSGDWEVQEDL